MSEELISIIVPCYNAEAYLERCVTSIIRQSCKNWEALLIDDGSTDGTWNICRKLEKEDPRIQAILQKDEGVSAARNRGLDMCRGNLVTFVDSDDYLAEDALSFMIKTLHEYHADAVMVGHNRVEKNGFIHCDSAHWTDSEDTEKIQEDILLNRLPNFVWGKLYKKELWQGIRFPVGQLMEDFQVLPDVMFRAQKLVLRKKPLYFYSHENAGSIMSKAGKNYIRLKYGQFLAWRKHGEIAEKVKLKSGARLCLKKALHAAIRAILLDYRGHQLTAGQKQDARQYIKDYQQVPLPAVMAVSRYLILNDCQWILRISGNIQMSLVEYQQQRRSRKQGG